VPWTRAVVDGPSSYRGEPIALLPFLRARRHELVLKPAHAHGGAGVVLGWECSESTWDDALATALGTPYVAQERAFGDTTSHPVAGPDGPVQQTLLYDWNPFVWNDGRAFGAIARLGQQSILNVMAGASLVPVFSAAEQSR